MQIVAKDLVIERGGRVVIDGLSLSAGGGEALILAGPNGAGKTTLLRALAGYLPPARGSIRLDGGEAELTLAEQAHVVGHANALKPSLTVAENVAFWSDYLGGGEAVAARTEAALAHFGLGDLAPFPVAYLSAGQRRRTCLARLLACWRPVWLLDEPTVSLDAASSALLTDAANTHLRQGGIVIAATHLPLGLTPARELRLSAQGRAA